MSAAMLDENAFGLIISYLHVEDDEYGLDPEAFADRLGKFNEAVSALLSEQPLAEGVSALDFGHAVYLEWADGDQVTSPIVWLRQARSHLKEQLGIDCVGILSHGSRWLRESESLPETHQAGGVPVTRIARSSEALRRALYAETACHGDEESANTPWGNGLYLDTEAVEALALKLKNAPTPLEVGGATFYRAGS